MSELARVLDGLVTDAPVERASWNDVQMRARSRRGRNVLAVALVAAALLALAGTAVGVGVELLRQQERFHASRPDHPGRLGPIVEIVSGESWALLAWRSEAGVCVDFAIPGNSPFGCDFPVRGAKAPTDSRGSGPPTHAVAGFVSGGGLVGGDGKATIFGVAAQEVEAVTVELRDGREVDAPVYEAPPQLGADVRFFVVRLQLPRQPLAGHGPIRAYKAYDGDGRLIERFED